MKCEHCSAVEVLSPKVWVNLGRYALLCHTCRPLVDTTGLPAGRIICLCSTRLGKLKVFLLGFAGAILGTILVEALATLTKSR